MNRNLKFKVWDHQLNVFKETFSVVSTKDIIIGDSHWSYIQFTGFEDINKKEIYEDFYIKRSNFVDDFRTGETYSKIGKVYWSKGHGGFAIEWRGDFHGNHSKETCHIDFHCDSLPYSEIVGNVFQNPELNELFKGGR